MASSGEWVTRRTVLGVGGVCGGLEGGLGVGYDLEAGLGVQAFEGFIQKEEIVGG